MASKCIKVLQGELRRRWDKQGHEAKGPDVRWDLIKHKSKEMGEEKAAFSHAELKPSEMSPWDRGGAGDAGGTTGAGCGCWEQEANARRHRNWRLNINQTHSKYYHKNQSDR